MEQLLRKWADMASDECKVKALFGVDRWELMGLGANYEEPFEGTVIVATIKAIEARWWKMRISSLHGEGGTLYGCMVVNKNRIKIGRARHDSLAQALLEAYLYALESEVS